MLSVLFFIALVFSVTFCQQPSSDVTSVVMRAAATGTYNSRVGGGAWNTGVNDMDVKGELQGKDYRCGDLATHFLYIEMSSNALDVPSQCLTIGLGFTADTTGQPAVAYGEVFTYNQEVLSRTKLVENGANGTPNGPTCTAGPSPGIGKFGRDCAPLSRASIVNGVNYPQNNEVVTYVEGSTKFTAPLFSGNAANMIMQVKACGLERGEIMVLRFDAKIYCNPGFTPTGNLQAYVDSKLSFDAANKPLNTGNQNVNLKGVAAITGATGCTAPPATISANDFNATITVYSSSQTSGGNYQRYLWYSWSLGQYKLENVLNSNIAEVHTFDTACSFLHDGVTQYTQSTCGCEATFISNTQPQLFLSLNSSFYSATGTPDVVNGINVLKYTRIDNQSSVTELYLNAQNTNIVVKAVFFTGEYWIFNTFNPGAQSPSLFTLNNGVANSTCTCKRAIVMMVVMERDRHVSNSDWAFMVTFAGAILPAQFANSTVPPPANTPIPFLAANMGLMYYDCPTTTAARNVITLPVVDGYAYQQVRAAAYRSDTMSCLGTTSCGSTSCTSGTWASPSQAIIFAANHLNTSQKLGQRVILLINRGWNPLVALNQETSAMLTSAVAYAESLKCKVLAVTFSTVQWLNDLNWQVSAQDPDNLVYRYLASDLIKVDNSFPVAIISKICVAQANPCGSCCGQCEPTCGTCLSVTSCAPTNNCSITSELVGNATKCCVINTNPVDPCKTTGTCQSAVCNAVTGQCSYTNTCTGADTACFNYNCVAGSCVKTSIVPPNSETSCTISQCVNNSGVFSITTTPRVCPTQNCFTFQCVEGQGCVGTAVAVTNNCFVCDRADGVVKPRVCPVPDNLCEVSTCSAATGFVCNVSPKFPTGCRNLSDACDTSFCNTATGTCTTQAKSCPAPANKCNVTSCNSQTGNCDFRTTVCTQNNETQARECQAATCSTLVVCAPSTGLCSCSSNTCSPTNAPTRAPTFAPTNAPTPNPTFAPTNAPTPAPTRAPTTLSPTETPTLAPTRSPTEAPTAFPTGPPVLFATPAPTESPTSAPTPAPTSAPTPAPTPAPTWAPTETPTEYPTRSPSAAPTEGPTIAPTNAPTAAPTALCVPGDCLFDACSQSICIDGNYALGEEKCTTPVVTNCTAVREERGIDYCVESVTCDGTLGCVFTTKTCPQPTNPCKTAVADKTNPNCCIEIDFRCNDNDNCTTYTCDTTSPSRPPTCIVTDLCVSDPNNKCILTGCAGGAIGCANTTITCESTKCSTAVCNPATGFCEATPFDCDDKNNCTIDTCDPVLGCVFTPIVCPPSANPCQIANVCDPTNGGCPTTPKNCNDGIECTIDSCNASTGECSHIPDNFYCKDPNPCVINGTCTLTGCTALPKNCTADFEKQPFCTVWKCIDFLGCSGEPRQCANETNGTCTVFNCSETKAECEKTESACLSFFGIVAGLIVAGLVVGVVAAALIIAGATAGSASYAVSQSANNEKNQSVNANPLYRGGGRANEVVLG